MNDSDVALTIARRIAAQAVWDAGECNWIGSSFDVPEGAGQEPVEIYRALDETLYDGTAGVGLFLAEAYAASGDGGVGDTARGALRHATAAAERGDPTRSLYSGSVGVALAAARCGVLLGDTALGQAARLIARRAAATPAEDPECDLLLGAAGGVLGMVVLAGLLDEPACLAAAREWGAELLSRADDSGAGLSWPSAFEPDQRNLTGYSHGTAGIAHALLELGSATGDAHWSAAAERAFDYERSVYDPGEGNWPDFREKPGRGRARSFATFWCHGAPGIALSRLRAMELLPGEQAAELEMHAALATTRRSLERDLGHARANYSLCHGMAGNAEAMSEGGDAEIADAVAQAGAGQYGERGDFPCGTLGGETPGLFLGLAGIGHFYLRRAVPEVPSVMLIRPADWAAEPGDSVAGSASTQPVRLRG